MWKQPEKWNKLAGKGKCLECGGRGLIGREFLPIMCDVCKGSGTLGGRKRARVFCASLCDVFEDWQKPMTNTKGGILRTDEHMECIAPNDTPVTMDTIRYDLFHLIRRTPNLDWLVLTKRPQNVMRMMAFYLEFEPFPVNIWIGTSVENQATADERLPVLKQIPASIRFVSYEPALGPVNFLPYLLSNEDAQCKACGKGHGFTACPNTGGIAELRDANGRGDTACAGFVRKNGIHQIIVGGESGADARVFRTEWATSTIGQCREAQVKCFVKQLGENATTRLPDGETWPGHDGPLSPVQFSGDGFGNYHISGLRDKKGGDLLEWPSELRVREFPEVAHA